MDTCKICDGDKEAHARLNHEFSTTGQLIAKQATPRQVQLAGSTIDVPLRLLLMEKGIITHTELTEVEARVAATVKRVARG